MFIWSVKASSLKFLAGAIVCIGIIAAMIIIIPESEGKGGSLVASNIDYDGIHSEEDIVKFIKSFGWEVQNAPDEITEVTIPDEFDKIFVSYNEIQKRQGLDLSDYKRRKVTRYTYTVTNFPDYDGKVLVNVIVYRSRVIGGDICTASPDGFVYGFEGK